MRNLRRVPVLAVLALLFAACSGGGTATGAPSAAQPSAAAPSTAASTPAESAAASGSAAPAPAASGAPAADCARSDDPNAMQMWERSGGNKGMVDQLVCDWNTANPDKPINLSYIPHAEMVGKIAQGIATGDVPDLMGMDLIYAPQFENAGQLVDLTDKIKDWPELTTASPGHMTVATFNDRLYGVPLYADVSALFYNKDLFKKAGLDPEQAADEPRRAPRVRRQDHGARRRHQGLLPARQLRGLQHLHGRPADVGVRRDHRGRQVRRRAARRRRRQGSPPVGPRHGQGRQRAGQRTRPRPATRSPSSSAPARSA